MDRALCERCGRALAECECETDMTDQLDEFVAEKLAQFLLPLPRIVRQRVLERALAKTKGETE